MIHHLVNANVKRFQPFMIPLLLIPYVLLIMDRLAANSIISHATVGLTAKFMCLVTVSCTIIRLLLLFGLHGV